MKQYFIITILLAFNYFNAAAQHEIMNNSSKNNSDTDHQNETTLGIGIFKALKEGNSDNWIMLYPTNDEYKNVLQLMLAAKTEGLTQQSIDEMLVHRKKEAAAAYTTEFEDFIKQADSLGISWRDAVYQKFDYLAVYPEKVKLKYLTGNIRFSCKLKHFIIEGIEALLINQGYRLQAVKAIRQIE